MDAAIHALIQIVALYMATLSTIKAKMPHLDPFYKRVREARKLLKAALIAAMR